MGNFEDNHDKIFFERYTVVFKKEKATEWEALSKKMRTNKKHTNRTYLYSFLGGLAAMLATVLLVSQLYTKTFQTEGEEQKVCQLPDGSEVLLNATSVLTYSPLKWYVSRTIKLEGEAFFEVKKGSRFSVISENGIVQVLGTSFNVYARNDAYKVSCVTGKVQVNSKGKVLAIVPGESVILDTETRVIKKIDNDQDKLLAWKNRSLIFKGESLRKVLNSLEQYYNVYIAYYTNGEHLKYSGNISLKNKLEDNLSIVCKPFQKSWEKKLGEDGEVLYIIN